MLVFVINYSESCVNTTPQSDKSNETNGVFAERYSHVYICILKLVSNSGELVFH